MGQGVAMLPEPLNPLECSVPCPFKLSFSLSTGSLFYFCSSVIKVSCDEQI